MMAPIKTETRENPAKRFADAFILSEENNFKSYFSRELWSPDQGAALVAGLDPETYRNGRSPDFCQNLNNLQSSKKTR
jgi:hypothetical protein